MVKNFKWIIDGCDGKELKGWLMDKDFPDSHVQMKVFIDGQFLCNTSANIFRQDLLDAGLGNGEHSFCVSIPDNFFDGMEHVIALGDAVTDFLIPDSTKTILLNKLQQPIINNLIIGCLDSCNGNEITGWAINNANPQEPVKVNIFIDEELISQVIANLFRKDLLDKQENGNCAFKVSIPNKFLDDIKHNVDAYEAETKTILAGSPKTFKFVNKFIGRIDSCTEKGIKGWIANKNILHQPVDIDVFIDDELIATVTANLFRPDLLNAKIGDGNRAFAVPVPAKFWDDLEHIIKVKEVATGEPLIRSGKKLFCKYSINGKVEELRGSQVIGWISNNEVELQLYIDEQLIPDAIAIKETISETKFNFNFQLPITALDGCPHLITVKVFPYGKIIGALAEILPFTITPWDALQKYAGKPLPATLSPATAYRYDSMRAALKALSKTAVNRSSAEWKTLVDHVAQLGTLHEVLLTGFEKNRTFLPLVFPIVSSPTVSIVIPVHNKFAVTYNCLCALLFAYNKTNFEVIVVDDGSNDETVEILNLVNGITYLRNETALGFIHSCNRGSRIARGKYVVMLNNDTEPTAYWLDEMLFVFDNFDAVGLVGSKLLYANGKLQEAGGIVWRSGNPQNYGRGANAHDPRFNYTRQVDYLSGASIMLPKIVWEQVGGFSEEFCPAYFEDTDLAFKVRNMGLKTVYAPLSIVYHFEGISSGISVTSGIKRYQEINRPKFKRKWMHACRLNDEEGNNPDLNKDRGISFRALVIDYQTPRPDIDAGSYAAIQEMRLLQSLGFKLTFIPENFAYLGQYTENLQRLGIESVFAPFTNSMQTFLLERGKEFDVIYITRYNVAKNHLNLIRHHAPQAKILFCNADLHFLRQLRAAIQSNDESAISAACSVREEELSVMRQVDVTLSYNAIEHAVIVSHNLSSTKVVTCPWVVDVQVNIPKFADRNDIAFLGGFGHPPNKGAVEFFIKQVMPLLRVQLPQAKFRIYGSNVPEEIKLLANNDVLIEGYVEEVDEVYNTCRVFVAPLLTGAGIKGKVIDALAHGVPSVLSPIAAEGTLLRHELEVMIAETPQEWVDAVIRLYMEQDLWEKMSQAACNFARQHYSFANGRKLMSKALEAVDVFVAMDNQSLVVNQTRPISG